MAAVDASKRKKTREERDKERGLWLCLRKEGIGSLVCMVAVKLPEGNLVREEHV